MTSVTANRVRDLNDGFRTSVGSPLGQWMFTRGVSDLGPEFVALAIGHIMGFDAFAEDNDPYGEHDFGAITIAGHSVFWKIDYYDLALEYGSDDPANPAITRRILTVMLASEY